MRSHVRAEALGVGAEGLRQDDLGESTYLYPRLLAAKQESQQKNIILPQSCLSECQCTDRAGHPTETALDTLCIVWSEWPLPNRESVCIIHNGRAGIYQTLVGTEGRQ